MIELCNHDAASLTRALRPLGARPVHVRDLLRDFYRRHGHPDLDGLNLPRAVREHLARGLAPLPGRVARQTRSADGAVKLLVALARGGAVEAVLIPGHRPDRAAGCVSSQIGCAMGCDFCASTRRGLERHLGADEIVAQFLLLRAEAAAQGRRLRTLVFMGMGEPMQNLDAVIDAIRRLAPPPLGGLGFKNITVSTVGVVPGIDRLAEADLGVHLALSLHAPDDATRARIVPSNRRWPVAQVMASARRFQARADRLVTIEYCLLADVNDSTAHADALAGLMEGFRAHVNLIPYNAIGPGRSGHVYARPAEGVIDAFLTRLRARGVVAHRRDTRGDDVAAACGQLRERAALGEPDA